MPKTALLIVDVQNDFCEGGSLAVPGGNAVAGHVARHLRHFKSEYGMAIATRDYHEDPPDHFSATPDFVNTWPPHCVAGTPGASLRAPIFNLVREKVIGVVVDKGQHAAAYSGFEATDRAGHKLYDIIRDARIERLDICGLATDYCVRATALDARKLGFQVRVLVNLTAPVNAESGLRALEEMRAAGCEIEAATAP